LALALLAHGLRIVGAFESHRQPIGKEPRAIGAEGALFLLDVPDIERSERKRFLFPIVILPAKDPHEFDQGSNV
jgi:hypothetical protein